MAFNRVNVHELEGAGPGGAVRFVRRQLGEGDFLRFDPETRRCPVAGPNGLILLAVGARRGSYEPRGPF